MKDSDIPQGIHELSLQKLSFENAIGVIDPDRKLLIGTVREIAHDIFAAQNSVFAEFNIDETLYVDDIVNKLYGVKEVSV